ncbi:hypothetical protein J1N09_01475 [Aureitalea sp. L0-47]|uniref:hypothetical protein n=1 Tax=Aureitalea sp. L0-47 TaxID=2816962 RepID=UPI002238A507|nr:hypothetical protein [Aureitalea sp. L0-47]MCW5518490.1 hypothetical protein [Aureitalea sp. L0-47]
MDNRDLAEQLKYSSSKWLYIVAWNNLLKQLFCPFPAAVLSDIGPLHKGQIVLVEEVKVTAKLLTVFIVQGSAYYYYHFDILID